MSLFLEERMKEQTEDPANDKIIFTYPWIITIDPREDPGEILNLSPEAILFSSSFRTCYNLKTEKWFVELLNDETITIHAENDSSANGPIGAWNGSSYSSCTIKMEELPYSFKTPDGFLSKFVEAFFERKVLKVVVYIELHLPLKWFYRPFDNPTNELSKKLCDEYPADMENDFKFVFLQTGDYSIKCPDGIVLASKMVLNISSIFMMNHFKKANGNELTVEYSIDIVKPLIYFLHTLCFEMPKSYDLEYAKRLLRVNDYFQPKEKFAIRLIICQSLCRKFVEKTTYSFDSLLRWLSLLNEYPYMSLAKMVTSMIANKYYFKWHQVFPQNARNNENAIFREVFVSAEEFDRFVFGPWVFDEIERNFSASLQCNVILP